MNIEGLRTVEETFEQAMPPDLLLHAFKLMVTARETDKLCWMLQRQGKASFVISCQGHEATQVGCALALQPGKDIVAPYYRDLGVALTLGFTPYEHFLSVLAKCDDPTSAARQMPSHFSSPNMRIITGSSPVATQVPHAVGAALAAKILNKTEVCMTFCGEGATSEGYFMEALNFAGLYKLGVVFVIENNGYAISVSYNKQSALPNWEVKARSFGAEGIRIDGCDIEKIYAAATAAVERARQAQGPTVIEALVERFTSHSSDDDQRKYRSQAELEGIQKRDPIDITRRKIIERKILSEKEIDRLIDDIHKTLMDDLEKAEAAPDPEPEYALKWVVEEPVE